jgi:type IV/VI secretion system ImpK/VasF family protein
MATLRELFAKLYAYVLLFEQEDFQRAASPSCDQVGDEIVSWVDKQKAEARGQGLDTDNQKAPFQEALFAFVAWADETLVKHATWEQRNHWRESQLQLKYFQTTSAGDELFDEHLPHLEQKEVQEVYYLSLGLGFKGRYYRGRPEDERRLAHDRHSLAQHLAVEDVQRLDKLTLQPYQVPAPPPKELKLPRTRLLLTVALALLVAVPLVYWAYLHYRQATPEPTTVQLQVVLAGNGRGMVSSTPEGIRCAPSCARDFQKGTVVTLQATSEPGSVFAGWSGDPDCTARDLTLRGAKTCTATFTLTTPPPTRPSPLQELLDKAIAAAKLQCAAVTGTVQDSTVSLGGRLASEADRAELHRRAQGIPGVTQVQDVLRIIPRPFCEIVELLEPFKKYSESQAFGLVVRLNKGGDSPVYVRGDNLVVDGQTPKAFASHVYIDNYAADGKMVGHLLPNTTESANDFLPNSPYIVGGPNGLQWKTTPPFGLELITVIASKPPLFDAVRPTFESVDSYLLALRQALQKVAPSDVAVTFFFLTTQ